MKLSSLVLVSSIEKERRILKWVTCSHVLDLQVLEFRIQHEQTSLKTLSQKDLRFYQNFNDCKKIQMKSSQTKTQPLKLVTWLRINQTSFKNQRLKEVSCLTIVLEFPFLQPLSFLEETILIVKQYQKVLFSDQLKTITSKQKRIKLPESRQKQKNRIAIQRLSSQTWLNPHKSNRLFKLRMIMWAYSMTLVDQTIWLKNLFLKIQGLGEFQNRNQSPFWRMLAMKILQELEAQVKGQKDRWKQSLIWRVLEKIHQKVSIWFKLFVNFKRTNLLQSWNQNQFEETIIPLDDENNQRHQLHVSQHLKLTQKTKVKN